MDGGGIRGEYDPERVARFKAPLRRLLARAREAAGIDEPRNPRPRPSASELVHRGVLVLGIALLTAAVTAVLVLPPAAVLGRTVGSLADRFGGSVEEVALPEIAQRSIVLDRDGETLAVLAGEENRKVVPLADVPVVTRNAVLAIEDAHFWGHNGVALGGLVRALLTNVRAGSVRQGGSTITQQLVKNVIVGGERSIDRKIREAKLAIALEKRMTKREILELYMNETYFGNGVYGIGTAAEYYFGKRVTELTLPESALLAGLIKAPERYEPLDNPQTARARRNLVLKRMADEGFIGREAAADAAAAPLGAKAHPLPPAEVPYFVEYVKLQILADERFGETREERARALFQGGLRIKTTLDLDRQREARGAVDAILTDDDDPAAALVAIDPEDGAIVAMVGGRDFSTAKYNLAVQGRRQAGSAFKPVTMVAALDAGVPPGLQLDTPSPIVLTDRSGKEWRVNNYTGRGQGIMDMRRATELSVNSYYAQLIERIGPERVVEMGARLGIQTELKPFLSIALGTIPVSPLEVASAYATLAAGGMHCAPHGILEVTDAQGEVLMRTQPECRRAIDGSVAALATDILAGVVERGTGRRNGSIGRPAAAKTGTTDEYTDAWYVGFTPQLSTAVWMGYPDSTKRKLLNIHGLRQVFGGSLPAQIWARFMRAAHEGLRVERFPSPPRAPSATVPDVVHLSLEEATEALEAEGFTVAVETVTSTLAEGIVVSQTPDAGEDVEAGTMVTLQVSDGKGEPEPSPSPSPKKKKPTASPSPSPTATTTASPTPTPTETETEPPPEE